MSKNSKQFFIAFPREILAAYESCQNMKNFASFVREATIRRLNSEFGFALDEKIGTFRRAQRTDLMNPQAKRGKLPELRRQAARARAGKKNLMKKRMGIGQDAGGSRPRGKEKSRGNTRSFLVPLRERPPQPGSLFKNRAYR